jgi:hypothetical protein
MNEIKKSESNPECIPVQKLESNPECIPVQKLESNPECIPVQKPKRMRCHLCNKKLKMISFTCKCEYNFCINHHNPHTHNCLYDYKKEREKEIEKNNPKLETKLVKI